MIYKVIGLMSGTSLDGLDIAYCEFELTAQGKWEYRIIEGETVEYDAARKSFLKNLMQGSAEDLAFTDAEFSYFMGKSVNQFMMKHKLVPDFIASHGHTIFHQPEKGFTYQIGSGAALSASTGIPVVSDFRSLDVALKGQGAPLVPIGDKLLFQNYDVCLNLGGIANLSFDHEGKRIAYDICPVNIVLNHYANKEGLSYDDKGSLAATGSIDFPLLDLLNKLEFYKKPFPKSLGKEWIDKEVFPILAQKTLSTADILATFCRHIAMQIANQIPVNARNVLVTGGGAFNEFLIREMQNELKKTEVIVPAKNIVMFKEALIFAFLGVLRIRNEVNCLSSVTGASADNVGGALYGNFSELL